MGCPEAGLGQDSQCKERLGVDPKTRRRELIQDATLSGRSLPQKKKKAFSSMAEVGRW